MEITQIVLSDIPVLSVDAGRYEGSYTISNRDKLVVGDKVRITDGAMARDS